MSRKNSANPVAVDGGIFTFVCTCDLDGCTWRGVTNTRANAWQMIARHVNRTHIGHPQIAAKARYTARNLKKSG